MTLTRKIAAALDETSRDQMLPSLVSAEDGPDRLQLELTAIGSIGVAFDSLEFATTRRPEWSAEELAAWGERLARRVSYLMEPLKVLEIDAEAGAVEIRSDKPTPRAELRSYYEVRLGRAGTCRLQRRVFDEGARRRRPASCQLTREVFERLVDDIVASAG